MDGLIIGLDLCDSYTKVSCLEEDRTWTMPTVICKKKKEDQWLIGKEAYASALVGDGIIADKLVKMVSKEGITTIEGVKYTGEELLKLFLEQVLRLPAQELKKEQVSQMVVTLHTVDSKLMDALMYCADYLKIPRTQVHVLSHTESFIYYVLSQKKDIWNNQVGLFDLSELGLTYYELKVQRGLRRMTVVAESETLEEGFNLDILDHASGAKLADKILCSCGERLMKKKLFSSVFLTGKGFERQDWAGEFMKLLCNRRKVFVDPDLFAKGAAFRAVDHTSEKTAYPFICVCEGRLQASVSLNVLMNGKENQLILASAGDNWYEAKTTVELLLDRQDYIELMITPLDTKGKRLMRIQLEGFPKRPDRTTKVELSIGFTDEHTMVAVMKDKGFGELFPASDAVVRQEVTL